jgi:uncharacterized paraquat-inducible protein A
MQNDCDASWGMILVKIARLAALFAVIVALIVAYAAPADVAQFFHWPAMRFWLPLIPLSALFAFEMVNKRRQQTIARRREKGLCLHCDYDLTGNVSGVCPECGRAKERMQNAKQAMQNAK